MLALLLILLWFNSALQSTPAERAAVQRVMQARAMAWTNSSGTLGRSPKRVTRPYDFAPRLVKIGVEDCPADFRAAWGDYVREWQVEAGPNPNALLALYKALRQDYIGAGVEVLKDRSKARQAGARLQSVAGRYISAAQAQVPEH